MNRSTDGHSWDDSLSLANKALMPAKLECKSASTVSFTNGEYGSKCSAASSTVPVLNGLSHASPLLSSI